MTFFCGPNDIRRPLFTLKSDLHVHVGRARLCARFARPQKNQSNRGPRKLPGSERSLTNEY